MSSIASFREALFEKQNQLKQIIGACSVQILKNNPKSAEAWCSGILVSFRGQEYLLSAGHALDNAAFDNLGLMIDHDLFKLWEHANIVQTHRVEDPTKAKFERMVWKLSKRMSTALRQKYDYFELGERAFLPFDLCGKAHFIMGYPLSYNKEYNGLISSKSLLLTCKSICEYQKYSEYSDRRFHINMGYNRKKMRMDQSENLTSGPRLKGMSGSGVWIVLNFNAPKITTNDIKLAGIFTHHFPEANLLVASRLSNFIDAINSL